jgi:hypothetical protein
VHQRVLTFGDLQSSPSAPTTESSADGEPQTRISVSFRGL